MMTLLPLLVFWGLWFLNFSTRGVFSPLLVLGAASLLLPIYFRKVSVEPTGEASQQRSRILDLFKKRMTWIIGFVWIFAGGSALGLYSILPLFLIKERGIDFNLANTLLGILTTLSSLAVSFLRKQRVRRTLI